MKKTISLLLALVLCLSLCACGADSVSPTESHTKNNNNSIVNTDNEELALYYGEWKEYLLPEHSHHGIATIIIEEAGVCYLDSVKYEWKYEQDCLTIWEGDVSIGYLHLIVESNGDIYLDCGIDGGGEGLSYKIGFQYAEDNTANTEQEETNSTEQTTPNYTVVEITTDNWSDYFEFKEDYSYFEDVFGGYGSMQIYYLLAIKDNIQIYEELSNVAVECSYTTDYRKLEIDPETKTYKWSDTGKYAEDKTSVSSMYSFSGHPGDDEHKSYYAAEIALTLPQGNTLIVDSHYKYNFNVIRIEGSIAIIEEE